MNTTDIRSKAQSLIASLNTPETMKVILFIGLLIGLALEIFGLILIHRLKKKNKKTLPGWICIGFGGATIFSSGIHLILYIV